MLDGAPISKLEVQVEHKEPVLKYTATGTAGGEDFKEDQTLTTDGKPATDARGDEMTAHWEGAALIIETTGAGGKALDVTRLTLSADGKTMMREYERKAADAPQKRHEIYEKR
jgi:hypothetical protein